MKPIPAVVALALTLPLAAGAAPVVAQSDTASWWTYASGDEVLALAGAPDGRLWAGTEGGGVVVWGADRTSFEHYLFPNQPGLPSNDVRDVAVAADGTVWLATAGGVVQVDGTRWRTYGTGEGLPSLDVTTVTVGPLGDLWAGTFAYGVAGYDPAGDRWIAHLPVEFIAGDEDLQDGPGDGETADIAVGDDGRVWVAHGRAGVAGQPVVSIYDPAARGWRHVTAETPGSADGHGAVTDQILALTFDQDGLLWLGTWGKGVLTYDPARDEWQRYGPADGLCGDNVWQLASDGQQVWATCSDGGAAEWDGSAWLALGLDDADARAAGLTTDRARAVAVAEGDAFLGLNGPADAGGGVAWVRRGRIQTVLSTAGATPASNDITALAFGPGDDEVWVGTRGAGLMHRQGQRWTTYTVASTAGDLVGDTVTDLLLVGPDLWVATTKTDYRDGTWRDGGVSVLDTDGQRWLLSLQAQSSELPDNDASSLAVDDLGRIWIGLGAGLGGPGDTNTVQAGDGLAVFDPLSAGFTEFYHYREAGGDLAGATVLDLAAEGSDLWVAASYSTVSDRKRGGGVSWYDGRGWASWVAGDDEFTSFHGSGDPADVDPFITGDVRSVAIDGTGRAWAGTWELEQGNLSRTWPYVDAVINRYQEGVWLSDAFTGQGWVSAVVEDSRQGIWLGTTRGHDTQEADLLTRRRSDTALGGLRLWRSGAWSELHPGNSGLAGNAITALAVQPSTGHLWVGTENNGLSVYRVGVPQATATPCVNCPTATRRPSPTLTVPSIATVPPATSIGPEQPTGIPGLPTPTAEPGPQPPPEVPEPATIVLLGAGLAGLAGYAAWRRRR